MNSHHERDLPLEVIEVLDGLFSGADTASPIDEVALAALVFGVLPDEAKPALFASIMRTPGATTRLAALVEESKALQGGAVIDGTGERGKRWALPILREALSAYTKAPSPKDPWSPHWLRAASRVGENVQRMLSVPRYATARGGANVQAPEGHFPDGVEVKLFADVQEDGALTAVATIRETIPGAADNLIGLSAVLDMLDPLGGAVPVGAAHLIDGSWTFRAESFGHHTGLPTGALPAKSFRLGVETMSTASNIKRLWLDVDEETLLIDLIDGPRLSNGDLTLRLEMPVSVHERYSHRTMELLVGVGQVMMRIGKWPLSEWQNGPLTLRIPVGEVVDGELACGSVIHARLA